MVVGCAISRHRDSWGPRELRGLCTAETPYHDLWNVPGPSCRTYHRCKVAAPSQGGVMTALGTAPAHDIVLGLRGGGEIGSVMLFTSWLKI